MLLLLEPRGLNTVPAAPKGTAALMAPKEERGEPLGEARSVRDPVLEGMERNHCGVAPSVGVPASGAGPGLHRGEDPRGDITLLLDPLGESLTRGDTPCGSIVLFGRALGPGFRSSNLLVLLMVSMGVVQVVVV